VKVEIFYETASLLPDGIASGDGGKTKRSNTVPSMNEFLKKVHVKHIVQTSVCLRGIHEINTMATCISVWYEDAECLSKGTLQQLWGRSVYSIAWPGKIQTILSNAGITTLGQLCWKTESELYKYRNCGLIKIRIIKSKLAELGLSLGMSPP
jgi:DNA-directed RNA polymerase alpha subunit